MMEIINSQKVKNVFMHITFHRQNFYQILKLKSSNICNKIKFSVVLFIYSFDVYLRSFTVKLEIEASSDAN